MSLRPLIAVCCTLAFAVAHAAEPCVRVRSGDAEVCMKFAAREQRTARSYGVHLGMPYTAVERELLKRGWVIDAAWARAQGATGREGDLICGSGYDAVCSTAFVRGDRHIYLTLSGTNGGTPLISIGDRE